MASIKFIFVALCCLVSLTDAKLGRRAKKAQGTDSNNDSDSDSESMLDINTFMDNFKNEIEESIQEKYDALPESLKDITKFLSDMDQYDKIIEELDTIKANTLMDMKLDESLGDIQLLDYPIDSMKAMTTDTNITVITASNKTEIREQWCPITRYAPFRSQPPEFKWIGIVAILRLFPQQWDYVWHYNKLESKSYSAKTDNQLMVLDMLGYDEDKFDCCNNHYEDYDWEDFITDYGDGMEYEDQVAALNALGYNEDNWENGGSETDEMSWAMLSEYQQQMAASKLCWTEYLWDESASLSEWRGKDGMPKYPNAW